MNEFYGRLARDLLDLTVEGSAYLPKAFWIRQSVAAYEGSMQRITVAEVVDGNTLSVWPPWNFCGQKGTLIRIQGLASLPVSSVRGNIARCKLVFLLLGSHIQVTKAYGVSGGCLVCDVQYCGRSLMAHFPEYIDVSARESDPSAPSSSAALTLSLNGN